MESMESIDAQPPHPAQHPQRGAGRYAPSPSGDLHFGNLRTALLAWLYARSSGRRFVVRVEDIDTQRSSQAAAQRQLEDLERLGLDWDGEVIYQSERDAAYQAALDTLHKRGLVYECYCSRKDIQEAARAPHAVPGQYPGTCRLLSDATRDRKRAELTASGRVPALRLRAHTDRWEVTDALAGRYVGEVDDFILRRGGNADQGRDWAYNLAVVVDDSAQGIDQVVRGDDLLSSAPRQAYLAHLLGLPVPDYIHVPLVLNEHGERLSKRDGAVTLRQMLETVTVRQVVGHMAASLGYEGVTSADQLREVFDPAPAALSRAPYVWAQGGDKPSVG